MSGWSDQKKSTNVLVCLFACTLCNTALVNKPLLPLPIVPHTFYHSLPLHTHNPIIHTYKRMVHSRNTHTNTHWIDTLLRESYAVKQPIDIRITWLCRRVSPVTELSVVTPTTLAVIMTLQYT